MKLSNVIKQLNEMIETNGDIDVCVDTGGKLYDVTIIETSTGGLNNESTLIKIG